MLCGSRNAHARLACNTADDCCVSLLQHTNRADMRLHGSFSASSCSKSNVHGKGAASTLQMQHCSSRRGSMPLKVHAAKGFGDPKKQNKSGTGKGEARSVDGALPQGQVGVL